MRIPKETKSFIDEELQNSSITDTWFKILKTHISNHSHLAGVENFSNHSDFSHYTEYSKDILEGLTLVEISVLYEYSLSVSDQSSRKSTGSYYTPEDIAIFMATQSKHFQKDKVWLDPCSGIGNLSYHLAIIQDNPEDFVLNHLILQDINPLSLKIAQTLFALYFQNNVSNYYEKIASNFIHQDFLHGYDQNEKATLFSMDEIVITVDSDDNLNTVVPHYDYVIVNPPYAEAPQDNRFITSSCGDLYGYFLEKLLIHSQGFISITPQSLTNSKKFATLRNLIVDKMKNLSIYAFDNMPDSVFRGYKYGSENTNTKNSVRACIIVAHNESKQCHQITPLLRWRASERKQAISELEKQLSEVTLRKDEIFPKLSRGTQELYQQSKQLPSLKSLLSGNVTGYSLIVPGTPRYYITASKTPLTRSSFHTLYFNNKDDMNTAFILLNSSYMYWWWRVNDSGMTLSKQTVLSLPLLTVNINDITVQERIQDLEASEKVNKVNKLNAGKNNENIKHPWALIRKVTESFIADESTVESLTRVHDNSFVIEPSNTNGSEERPFPSL